MYTNYLVPHTIRPDKCSIFGALGPKRAKKKRTATSRYAIFRGRLIPAIEAQDPPDASQA